MWKLSSASVAAIRRTELTKDENSTTAADVLVLHALEIAGIEFIDENGGGPGVRLVDDTQPSYRTTPGWLGSSSEALPDRKAVKPH
jgi:hypothetical protein